MSNFLNIDDLFGQQQVKAQWTLENIKEDKTMFQKLSQISLDIQNRYDIGQTLGHKIALQGINKSNGLIDSSEQLLEHLGLKEIEDAIIDEYREIYSEAGLIDRPLPKVDVLGQYIAMASEHLDGEASVSANGVVASQQQEQTSGFSFLDNL